jgi:hypothetical protein
VALSILWQRAFAIQFLAMQHNAQYHCSNAMAQKLNFLKTKLVVVSQLSIVATSQAQEKL